MARNIRSSSSKDSSRKSAPESPARAVMEEKSSPGKMAKRQKSATPRQTPTTRVRRDNDSDLPPDEDL